MSMPDDYKSIGRTAVVTMPDGKKYVGPVWWSKSLGGAYVLYGNDPYRVRWDVPAGAWKLN